jgi:hypothetical protein
MPSTGVATETSPRSNAMNVSHWPATKQAPVRTGCHQRPGWISPPSASRGRKSSAQSRLATKAVRHTPTPSSADRLMTSAPAA